MPRPAEPPPARPYQITGARFLRNRGRAFLGDEPGLGKSRQLIEAAAGNTLVVAPAMVLDGGTWDDEVSNWAGDLPVHQLPYTRLNRRIKTGKTASSTAPQMALSDQVRALGRVETLILDECHYVKGRGTTWTWAVREIARQADRVYLATGTPIPNWPHELFVPLQLMFPDDARPGGRFGSYWRWVEEWFRTAPSRFGGMHSNPDILGLRRCADACAARPPWDPCEHYHEFVAQNLGNRFLQRRRDDVLPDLPPLTRQQIKVEMTARQAAEYRSMRTEFIAEVDGAEIVAWSTAAKNVILDRMTTGLGVAGPLLSPAESGKFKRLEFDLASRARPTLVVAHYRDSVEVAAQVARKVGARTAVVHGGTSTRERGERVRQFQRGEVDVLCGSLETISEGLNLTAADMVIFVERSYKPSRNEQAERRIHRLGQTRPCTILDYVAVTPRGGRTLDGAKRELLARKTDQQMRTLTAAQFAQLL